MSLHTPHPPTVAIDEFGLAITTSTLDQLCSLGCELNANQYQAVHLAATYEDEREWFGCGLPSGATGIARELDIAKGTAREWIRVGHALRYLPLVDAAFAANALSYAKVRVLTRFANEDNEQELLDIAYERPADRLTVALVKAIDGDESDDERDRRYDDLRSFTSYTNADGMVVIRLVLAPLVAALIVKAVERLVKAIAALPADPDVEADAPADASELQSVVASSTEREIGAPADASEQQGVTPRSLSETLADVRRRWRPAGDDYIPTLAQQRADAFVVLFSGVDIDLSTEVVVHVRGDGNTLDDGTPISDNAIARTLDDSYVRLLIHDADRKPINASGRHRHPTERQKRVVMETHNHECVDCGSTDLLEIDHNPPFEQTRRTLVEELLPRCAPCHRAKTRHEREPSHQRRVA